MKKKIKWILPAVGLCLLLIVSLNCFFELREGEAALIQRFGRIEAVYVKEPSQELFDQLAEDGEAHIPVRAGTGLKWKVPFLDHVIKYPSMLLAYDTPSRQVITADKKKIYFDNNAQWRIVNPLRFYKGVSDIQNAYGRIDSYLYSYMNTHVGTMQSTTLITDKAAVGVMLDELNHTVSAACAAFGVDVFDIRIKRTDLPEENYQSIYNRMITERARMSAQYRSVGEEESLKIRSKTDREVAGITSEAARKAEILKGEGDSEAARIYNEAYSATPSFFEFYNLLDTYRLTVGASSTLVIPLSSPFAKYLLGAEVAPATAPPPT
ncbi:MAG: protease modulator HflC [Oscillospiraceae bacterium]|jgi:membrane protease subunit HflC|nr:protease modulator HflC [Oscillospiraceae bacterium]